MRKTLFLALALGCVMPALAGMDWDKEKDEVTFSGYTDNKLTVSGSSINLEEDTTFIVDEGKTVTYTGTVTGSGDFIKDGDGTLQTSINNATNKNVFTGDVFVNAGTLDLVKHGDDTQAYIGATTKDGNGTHATVSVADGATLILHDNTGISMPLANAHNHQHVGFVTTIDGGTSWYAEAKDKDYSWLQNVTISDVGDKDGGNALISIAATDSTGDKKGEMVTHSFSLVDTIANDKAEIKNTEIHCNESYMSGHITIDNSVVNSATMLVMTDFADQGSTPGAALKVQNHSEIYLGDRSVDFGDKYDSEAADYTYGMLQNVSIDATSKVNALKNSKGTRGRIALLGANELHVKSTEADGLAAKTDEKCGHDHDGRLITYTTDQLSGCYLYDPYADVDDDQLPGEEPGVFKPMLTSLNVVLDDNLLPELNAHDHFTVTLVLSGLDASEVITDHLKRGDHSDADGWYILGSDSPVKLDISQYTGVITMDEHIGLMSVTDDETGEVSTLFRFSMEKKDSSVPEPATATLSLLALAGLAARRRRH